MNKIWIFFLLFVVLASSCSKKTFKPTGKKKKFEIQESDFQYFHSRSKVKYHDDNNNLSFTANIRIKKDSIIWISLSPMLGIEAARGIITRDSMVLVDRLNKEYAIYDYVSLSEKFNFDLNYELIQSILMGNMPLKRRDSGRFYKEKEYLLVKQDEGEVAIDNYISPATMRVEKITMVDKPTSNSLTLGFNDFKKVESIIFPFSSIISLNYQDNNITKNTEINIDHSRIDVENNDLSFPFNIPDKYDRK